MALPMGIPGAFGLPVSPVPVRPKVEDTQRVNLHREEADSSDIPILARLVC
jgi:hypothetical protein